MAIEPDTKDWTWVLDRPCDECGFDASTVDPPQIPQMLRANTRGWSTALGRAGVGVRPDPRVWSTLEYACHVRDVHRLFDQRVMLMLTEDDPVFTSWDQDEVAVREAYHLQDPVSVELELIEAAGAVAGRYAGVSGEEWERSGRRADGAAFTVRTLARYHLHDVGHHLNDVGCTS